jgi:hypothetical protein
MQFEAIFPDFARVVSVRDRWRSDFEPYDPDASNGIDEFVRDGFRSAKFLSRNFPNSTNLFQDETKSKSIKCLDLTCIKRALLAFHG